MISVLLWYVLLNESLEASAEQNNGALEARGSISFVPNDRITPPTHPNKPDPNKPVTPKNPDGSKPLPGAKGTLTLDFSSSFDFGRHPISNKDEIYYAQAQSYFDSDVVTPNYAQVTDVRGTQAGWTLKVLKTMQFTENTTGKNHQLDGASISLLAPVAATNGDANTPVTQEVIQLIPGEETLVATAKSGTGAGTWVIRWGEMKDLIQKEGTASSELLTPHVQLFVPGKTRKEAANYKTTLKWILSDSPSN